MRPGIAFLLAAAAVAIVLVGTAASASAAPVGDSAGGSHLNSAALFSGPNPYIDPDVEFPEGVAEREGVTERSVEVGNIGDEPVTVNLVEFLEGGSQFTITNDDCLGRALGEREYCDIHAIFTPTSAGSKRGALEVGTSAGALESILLGQARANPGIETPARLTFGEIPAGFGDNALVRLPVFGSGAGIGAGNVIVESLTFSGEAAGEFSLGEQCLVVGQTIRKGETCSEFAYFKPQVFGTRHAQLKITTDFGYEVVQLEGVGFNGALLEPISPVQFSPQSVGTGAETADVTVQSFGYSPVDLGAPTISAADPAEAESFTIGEDTCGGSRLPRVGSCVVEVKFEPRVVGPVEAKLSIPSSEPHSPKTVALSGEGLANPGIGVGASALDFGTRVLGEPSVGPLLVTVASTGTTPLSVEGVEVVGPGEDAFELGADSCLGAPIEPGGECAIEVSFAPTVVGSQEAEMEIASDGAGEPEVIDLSGAAEAAKTTTTTTDETHESRESTSPPAADEKTAAPACVEPTVSRPVPYIVNRKSRPGVAGVRARFSADTATTIEVDASLVYRARGASHAVALGRRTLDVTSAYANFKASLPARLRRALPPGTKVTLKFAYAVAPTSACSSPGPTVTRSLATEVVRVDR